MRRLSTAKILIQLLLLVAIWKDASAFKPTSRAVLPTTTKTTSSNSALDTALLVRGGGADVAQLVDLAYEWAVGLGAPAALVAGAVIATLYESMSSGHLDIEPKDKSWVKMAKKMTRLLLVTAFILQIVCIFCTTILGTHLMSQPPFGNSKAETPLQYVKEHFEFEYLTSRIAFLQGLLTWLGAIALEHMIPKSDYETPARRNMEVLISSSLATLIIMMLSFYNGHMNFYANYFEMLCRYAKVTWARYVLIWPPRPLTILALPCAGTAVLYFFKVMFDLGEPKVVSKSPKKAQ